MLVPDLMHEFELGVWKGTFNHIVRLIHAQGDAAVKEFDHRYVTDFLSRPQADRVPESAHSMHAMPPWGRDKVRRFWHDVSTRKKLAARDYEAYLIVCVLHSIICGCTYNLIHHDM